MTNMHSLTGRYFILRQNMPHGGAQITRGKILGQLSEFLPVYLCEIIPVDPRVLVVPTQTLLSLDSLIGANLYDSEILMIEDWRSMLIQIEQADKEIAARQRRAEREATKRAEKIATEIVAAAAAEGDDIEVEFVPAEPAALRKLMNKLRERGRLGRRETESPGDESSEGDQ